MRKDKKKLCSFMMAVLCSFTLLNGCGSEKKDGVKEDTAKENIEENKKEVTDTALDTYKPYEYSYKGDDSTQNAETENLGEFSMQDIEGETYTQEMFADYDLTMVNVFTTWCTPCINEIPDLEKLRNEMKDQGVNVVGIVLNGRDGFGKEDEETLEKAKLLAEKTGASYPFLIPDEEYLNGRLLEISAVPETFFADREGNIVGETYSGSRSLEEWQTILEVKLKEVQQ